MTSMGTVDWVHRRGGDLAFSERLKFFYHGIRALAATKKRIRQSTKFRHMEFEDIVPPDSSIAMEAMAFCRETSEPFLFNHCLRSYFWARLLDDGSGPVDQEVLFTALMLHDIGMNEGYVLDPSDKYKCFTIVGARIARDLAMRHGWSTKMRSCKSDSYSLLSSSRSIVPFITDTWTAKGKRFVTEGTPCMKYTKTIYYRHFTRSASGPEPGPH